MAGRKITLQNVGSTVGVFRYQTLSTFIWEYQSVILPGQTKVIFSVDDTFSYDENLYSISVIENIPFPPSGSTVTTTTVSPIPNEGKTLIQISTISSTNLNWEYSVLNYGTNSILGPVSLGISSSGWSFNSEYRTVNGWMLFFSSQSNDDVLVKFINKNGSIVHSYSGSTNSYNIDNFGNYGAYFADFDNLKMIFTDFTNVLEYDIPSGYDDFYLDSNYDDSNSVGAIFIQRIGNYSSYILFKPTGYSVLYNWDSNSYNVDSLVYRKSNYFVIIAYSLDNDQYSFFNIYNGDGVLIKSENLLSNNPTSINTITSTPNTTNPIDFNGYVDNGTTSGDGVNAVFYVSITSGSTSVNVTGKGNNYQVGDTITFDGTVFGGTSGVDNITITVTSLGNFEYNEFDINFFGDGKMNLILWDGLNNNIPYLVYVYDGTNNEIYKMNHNRVTGIANYYDWITYYDDLNDESNDGVPSEDFHINFYDDDGSWNGNLYSMDYCNIVSWFNGEQSFTTYQFAYNDNYDVYLSLYEDYLGDSLILYSNRDDNYINYEVFTLSGQQTVQIVQTSSLDGWNFNNVWAGEKLMTEFYLQGTNESLFFIHNYDGTYVDDLYVNAGNDGSDYDGEYNSIIINNYFNDTTYYWNSSLDHIVTLPDFYPDWNSANNYTTTLNHNEGNFVLFNDATYKAIIVTKNSVTSSINISGGYDYNFRIGKNVMSYLYKNNSTDKIVVKVYNLQGLLLNVINTNETTYNNFIISENRVYLQTGSGSNYIHYLITANGYKTVTTSNNNSTYSVNDWA